MMNKYNDLFEKSLPTINEDFVEICAQIDRFNNENKIDVKFIDKVADYFVNKTNSYSIDKFNEQTFLEETELKFKKLYSHKSNGISDINRETIFFIKENSGNIVELGKREKNLALRIILNYWLIEKCLLPLDNINPENLDYDNKLLHKVNYCVILSRSNYFEQYLLHCLNDLNNYIVGIEVVSPEIWYRLGLLNFKRHDYEFSLLYLKHAKVSYESKEGLSKESLLNDRLFQVELLISYCHEYRHEFDEAIIELIGISYNELILKVQELTLEGIESLVYNPYDLDDRTRVLDLVNGLLKSGKLEFKGLYEFAQKRDEYHGKNQEYIQFLNDTQEILHSLAHCCNEFGIKLFRSETHISTCLIILSRALMLNVASNEIDFKKTMDFNSCLAMIYGENKEYDICFDELLRTVHDKEYDKQNDDLKSEFDFYCFLLSKISYKLYNSNIQKQAEIQYQRYVQKATESCDYDARAHIEIFKFKYEIAQILKLEKNSKRIFKNLKGLYKSFESFFSYLPSIYVNGWVRNEHFKVSSMYEFLLEFYSEDKVMNIDRLFNLADRYINFYTNSKIRFDIDITEIDIISKINADFSALIGDIDDYKENGLIMTDSVCLYDNQKSSDILYDSKKIYIEYSKFTTKKTNIISITDETTALKLFYIYCTLDNVINDFVNPQSIFILAPLTTAIPYQYQTGNFSTLVKNVYDTNVELRNDKPALKMKLLKKLRNQSNLSNDSKTKKFVKELKNISGVKFVLRKSIEFSDEYVYSTEKNNFRIVLRPLYEKELIKELLEQIACNFQEYCIHEECIQIDLNNGYCQTKHEVFSQWTKSSEILRLLKVLFISINDLNPKDNILIKIDPQSDERYQNEDWTIVITKEGVEQELIRRKICELEENDEKDEYSIDECNMDEPFVVISYTRSDKNIIEQDLRVLEIHGLNFWYDRSIAAGLPWDDQVFNLIEHHNCKGVLCYLSKAAIEKSEGVYKEVEFIYKNNKPYIGIPIAFNDGGLDPIDNLQSVLNNLPNISRDRYNLFTQFLPRENTYVWRSSEIDFDRHIRVEKCFREGLRKWGINLV